jgi:hypothetical protein
LRNTKISIFGGISKFLKLIVFGQILAKFGSFGQSRAYLGRQIWVDFAALTVAESIPEARLKSLNPLTHQP